jgi:hypothetical protein
MFSFLRNCLSLSPLSSLSWIFKLISLFRSQLRFGMIVVQRADPIVAIQTMVTRRLIKNPHVILWLYMISSSSFAKQPFLSHNPPYKILLDLIRFHFFGFRNNNSFTEPCVQPPTWRTRSLYLCPPVKGRHSYKPTHRAVP